MATERIEMHASGGIAWENSTSHIVHPAWDISQAELLQWQIRPINLFFFQGLLVLIIFTLLRMTHFRDVWVWVEFTNSFQSNPRAPDNYILGISPRVNISVLVQWTAQLSPIKAWPGLLKNKTQNKTKERESIANASSLGFGRRASRPLLPNSFHPIHKLLIFCVLIKCSKKNIFVVLGWLNGGRRFWSSSFSLPFSHSNFGLEAFMISSPF